MVTLLQYRSAWLGFLWANEDMHLFIPGPDLVSLAKISWYFYDSTYLILRQTIETGSHGSPCKNVNISLLAIGREQDSLRCP